MATRKLFHLFLTTVGVALFLLPVRAEKIPIGAKWQRFELTFKSNVNYTNPVQEAEMRVLFVSPLGETNRVYGFWDGGKTWRVRFQPGFPGRWTYYTMCSDTANRGLHEQRGEFLCLAAKGESRFDQHGPVQVARSQQHLEHADHTPFLWLGEAAELAAIKSAPADWDEFVQTRATQKFNVVQWRLNPERRAGVPAAFTERDRISVNLDLFRQLDAKIAAANRAGLLSAIAPLWEISDQPEKQLTEDQAIRLLRYAAARWGADHVAWIVAFECDSTGAQATRWQNIGRAVFNQVAHAPVVLLPGESFWTLDAFRRERWVDVLGVQTTVAADENSLPWLLLGPLALERQKLPARPLITVAPPAEVAVNPQAGQITGDLARRLLWWCVLLNTPAGVSYQAKEVANWTTPTASADAEALTWRKALSLRGAEAIAPLADGLGGKEFWRLEPLSQTSLGLADSASPRDYLAAAQTKGHDLTLLYVPEAHFVQVAAGIIADGAQANWLDPRTGELRPAPASHLGSTQRFTTPGPGDWLLVLKQLSGKSLVAGVKKPEPKIDKRKRD